MRHLPRCVAIGVLAAFVFAAPAAAAEPPPGPGDPPGVTDPINPPIDDPSTTSSTSATTTTTKPDKNAPETKRPGATQSAVPVDLTPTAGPPELAKTGVLLPDDSLAAATEELALERAKVDAIRKRLAGSEKTIDTLEKKIVAVRRARKQQEDERLERAVATYRGQSSGWQLGVIVEHGLEQERAVYLVAAVDAETRKKIKALNRSDTRFTAQLHDEREVRVRTKGELDDAVDRVNRLLDKLAASSGAITLIDGVLVYVPTGPSAIALLADAADKELSRLLLGKQPVVSDAKWLSARHFLAAEIARGKGLGAAGTAALEQSWAATSPRVVHAMLFALRQVGKEYIYATAGPQTFDCSGLTKAAYAQIRLGLPHFSGAQLHVGLPVKPDALRPGDLLTYGPDGSEHVTMYIGDDLVVEAKGRAYGVIIGSARVDPTKGFAGATRVVP